MTAMRTLLGMSLVGLGVTSTFGPLYAQQAPLPDPRPWLSAVPTAPEVASGLTRGAFEANACHVRAGELSCTCLKTEGQAYRVWSGSSMEGVALRQDDGAVVSISEVLLVDGVWVLKDVVVARPRAALVIDELQIADAVRANGLVWHERSDDELEVACGVEVVLGATVAKASSAVLTESGWRLEGYRVGPWPVPLAGRADRAALGLLPPTARATSEGAVEFEGGATVYGPLFVFAAAGVEAPFGVGAGVVSERRGAARALRAMVAADTEVSGALVGDVSFGTATHLRGHFEHPVLERAWAVRRLEHGGFFRDWRATHVGVAATAGAHALQLSGSLISELGRPVDEQAALLTYGTTFPSGPATWTVDLEHQSDRTEDTRHSTTVGLGVELPIGWVERAWLAPRLDVLANYAAVTVNRGFDASTTLSALATAEAGLALDGRFGRARHRLAPVVRVGGELGGIQQRQAREGAPTYPYEGPDRWRWAVAFLEQSFRDGPLLIELPVGVFADALGDESIDAAAANPVVFGRAGAALPQARLDVAAACLDGCERVGTYVGAHVRPRSDVTVGYSVSDLDDSEVALVFADRLTARGFTAVRLLGADAPTMGFGHVASLGWRIGRLRLGVDGRYGSGPQARGIGAEIGYHWAPLGWGIGVGGGIAIPTEQWALSAGLRFAR